MKKRKKHKSVFGEFFSPYMSAEKVNMDSCWEKYKNDPAKTIIINGQQYSKIICRCEFYLGGEYSYWVFADLPDLLSVNDVLEDEKGNEYVIISFEMIRYADIPEWHPRIAPMVIKGETHDIGNYLALKPGIEK